MLKLKVDNVLLTASGYDTAEIIKADGTMTSIERLYQNYQEVKKRNEVVEKDTEEIITGLDFIDDPLKSYEYPKKEFTRTTLRELGDALEEIRNKDNETPSKPPCPNVRDVTFCICTLEISNQLKNMKNTLTLTQKFIENKLDILDELILTSDDYTTYSQEDKKLVQELEQIYTILAKMVQIQVTYDREKITRELLRGYSKIEKMIGVA